MITVGLAHDLHISAAAVVRDGEVVAAIPEERLNRQKIYKGFPHQAFKECLRLAGASASDVDAFAFGWNPARHLDFPNFRNASTARWRPEYLYAVPNFLLGHTGRHSGEQVEQIVDGLDAPILYYDHQICHAANAFFLSGWERAAFHTADGRGERESAYWGRVDRTKRFQRLGQVYLPHSLGLVYATLTQYLGYHLDSDEWKVMALASYGEPNNAYLAKLRKLIDVKDETGQFWVDQRYFSYGQPEAYGGVFYTPEFVEEFGPPRVKNGEILKRHRDIAWALQRVFEEVMTRCLCALHKQTGEPRLVAAGGCYMNSVFNGKITTVTPFKELFISSCPDDSGTAVGAALHAYYQLEKNPKYVEHKHNYWGPSYDHEIKKVLDNYKVQALHLDNPCRTGAQLLADGLLVGWFQGRMEFGQRALGNRSILADPRHEKTKDQINAAVKYRESFRPFAPAILADRAADYFECETGVQVPYMERVFQFRPEVRNQVGAVVHVDGSGRLQTVDRETNARFYDLIMEFEKLTGVPIVLNTSFNVNGEPIVCSPTDAIRTYYSCGLNALILGDFLLCKEPARLHKWTSTNGTATVKAPLHSY